MWGVDLMLGFSLYLSECRKVNYQKLLKKAKKAGSQNIFTSLHIPEDNPDDYLALLKKLAELVSDNDMNLIVDISPSSLSYLNLNVNNAEEVLNWGVTGFRLDYGFEKHDIVELSKKMIVVLNASTVTKSYLESLISLGLNLKNVEAMHNFYPRPETGLCREFLIRKNKLLKSYKIKVSAFIPGDNDKRYPLFEGLPSLEEHRNENPVKSFLDLKYKCLVDNIYVGDLNLSNETLMDFERLKEGYLLLRFKGFEDDDLKKVYQYLNKIHRNRLDQAQNVVRLSSARSDLQNMVHLLPRNNNKRTRGSITIDNIDYGRYCGEIQISLTDMPANPKVNVIGQVVNSDLYLLDYIKRGEKFKLFKINN